MEEELRDSIRKLCERYPDEYWQSLDRERAYPEKFVGELNDAGYLACMIPEEFGRPGLGIREAAVILEEINRSGGNGAACHAQMYTMGTLLVDLRDAGDQIRVSPLDTMINHETNEVFFDGLELPEENLIGEEGKGFYHILSGMNAERILLASESVGDALHFVDRSTKYARERVVFERPIGQNQGVQFPIARAYIRAQAAAALRDRAVKLCEAEEPCGAEANMCKLLASEAAWEGSRAHGAPSASRNESIRSPE